MKIFRISSCTSFESHNQFSYICDLLIRYFQYQFHYATNSVNHPLLIFSHENTIFGQKTLWNDNMHAPLIAKNLCMTVHFLSMKKWYLKSSEGTYLLFNGSYNLRAKTYFCISSFHKYPPIHRCEVLASRV